jgi:flagellar basal body-associated protein FliL
MSHRRRHRSHLFHRSHLIAVLLVPAALLAVEARPGDSAAKTAEAPVIAAPVEAGAGEAAKQPDPTAAIVAEGKYVYRQRDLDALVLIATRHAKARFGKAEEERLRQVLVGALIAREPLLDALADLPGAFTSAGREALVLDLLDYQAEPAKPPAAPTSGEVPGAAPAAPAPAPTDANGPLLVRLPALTLSRTLPSIGKRQLSLTIALFFRDPTLAKKLQDQAPLVQDAILGYLQSLPAAQFAEPNQATLKDGITAAIIAKVAEFPPDAVLIPEMDAAAAD